MALLTPYSAQCSELKRQVVAKDGRAHIELWEVGIGVELELGLGFEIGLGIGLGLGLRLESFWGSGSDSGSVRASAVAQALSEPARLAAVFDRD